MKRFTAILANGDFPRKGGEAWRLLASARRVVACDGAADTFRRRFGRKVDCVIGDFDSVRAKRLSRVAAEVVRLPEQDTNDLTKAINYCRKLHWGELIVFGANGKREDHALGNVFRAMEAGIKTVSDYGRFVPFKSIKGRYVFREKTGKGSPISFFATDRATRMKSKGLEWPLDDVRFENLYCATLNRTTAAVVEVTSDRPAFVYVGMK